MVSVAGVVSVIWLEKIFGFRLHGGWSNSIMSDGYFAMPLRTPLAGMALLLMPALALPVRSVGIMSPNPALERTRRFGLALPVGAPTGAPLNSALEAEQIKRA